MALKPMLDETPKGPSPEDQLAQERADRARAEQEFRERQAAYEARLEEMSRGIDRASRQAPAPAMSAAQAKEELGLTAEDIQRDPDKALQLLEDHIRSKAVAEATQAITTQYGGLVSSLANTAVSNELQNLQGRKYWAEAQGDVSRYFEEHPEELQPGRVSEVYNYFVGQNIEAYESARSKTAEADRGSTSEMRREANREVESPVRGYVGKPIEGSKDAGPEPELTDEEELVRQAYNAYGANISKREWVAISQGKVFPKKRGSDWDAGYYKDDRNVSHYE